MSNSPIEASIVAHTFYARSNRLEGRNHSWIVSPSCFGREAYRVYGYTLQDAIIENAETILAETVPYGRNVLMEISGEWHRDLFSGRGGVEVTMKVMRSNSHYEWYVAWIYAPSKDLLVNFYYDCFDKSFKTKLGFP